MEEKLIELIYILVIVINNIFDNRHVPVVYKIVFENRRYGRDVVNVF